MKRLFLLTLVFITLKLSAQNIIYVDQNATGSNDGSSWANALTDPSEIIFSPLLDSTDIVWVAAGTYYPTYDISGDPTPVDARTKVFALQGLNLKMYGGFNGTETQLNQRNWVTNPTILSGDIGIVGDETDNCRTVFLSNSGFTLDGFTITGGYADGTTGGATRYGGGLYIYGGTDDIVVKNCIIKDNKAHYDAGIYCVLSSSSAPKNVIIENTRFSNNYARWGGAFGFIVNNSSGAELNVTLSNCLVDNNGSGVFESTSGGSFSGGRFSCLDNNNFLNSKIINTTFAKNTDNGGVNMADRSLLGVQGLNTNAFIYNTIFWDNTVNTAGTSIGYGTNSAHTPTVATYNTISQDTLSNISFVGISTNNTQTDPLFTNSSSGDFSLQSASTAINTGDTTGIAIFIPTTDLAQNIRLNGAIDLGCYEYQTTVGSIEQKLQNNFTIYPNPTSSQLTINSDGITFESISIIDITGRPIKNVKFINNTIDVHNLANGIYFITVKTNLGTQTKRFVKQ